MRARALDGSGDSDGGERCALLQPWADVAMNVDSDATARATILVVTALERHVLVCGELAVSAKPAAAATAAASASPLAASRECRAPRALGALVAAAAAVALAISR